MKLLHLGALPHGGSGRRLLLHLLQSSGAALVGAGQGCSVGGPAHGRVAHAQRLLFERRLPRQPCAPLAARRAAVRRGAGGQPSSRRSFPRPSGHFLPARVYPALSAAAFALIHWESGSREVIATFLLGVVLAALYLRIRNLWPFVAGHAITDMLTFTGTYAY
jgi:hypothetical protein